MRHLSTVAKWFPKIVNRRKTGAPTTRGTKLGPKTSKARSIARPILPTVGDESKVEQDFVVDDGRAKLFQVLEN